MPTSVGDGAAPPARCRRSAGPASGRDHAAGDGLAREVGFDRVGDRDHARGSTVPGRPPPRSGPRPRACSVASRRAAGTSGRATRSSQLGVRPASTAWPDTVPVHAQALPWREVLARRPVRRCAAVGPGSGRRSPADGVLGGVLEGAGEARAVPSASPPCAGRTPTTCICPVVRVPVLSSTMVSTRRVDSSISGPLDQDAQLRSAPGADQQRRGGGQAQRARAGDDQHRDRRGEGGLRGVARWPASRAGSAADSTMTTGTKTAETRSASRCAGALPVCASSTSSRHAARAGCRRRPGSPARRSRPPALIVAPTTASPGSTSTGTGSPVSSEASIAEVPSTTMPSVATFSPGRTTNRSPTPSSATGTRVSTPAAQHGHVLGAQVQQGAQRRAGAALGAGLEVAPGQQEGGDRRPRSPGRCAASPLAEPAEQGDAHASSRSSRRRRGTAPTATSR